MPDQPVFRFRALSERGMQYLTEYPRYPVPRSVCTVEAPVRGTALRVTFRRRRRA